MAVATFTQLVHCFEAIGGSVKHNSTDFRGTGAKVLFSVVNLDHREIKQMASRAKAQEHTAFVASLSHEIGHCLAEMAGFSAEDEVLAWCFGEAFFIEVTGVRLPPRWRHIRDIALDSYGCWAKTGDFPTAHQAVKELLRAYSLK